MHSSFTCLQADELKKFIAGDIAPKRVDAIEDHLSNCEACRGSLEATVGDRAWWRELESALCRDMGECDYETAESKETVCQRLMALLGPTEDPSMLGRIGPYEVIGLLGYGGMGAVFKAHDPGLNRYVAIKILLPHLALSGAARARFRREGQAAAAIVDDCVLPIYAVDEWQGIPYLVMQYTQGVSLQKRIHDRGPLELKEILRIGLQAARGLAAAHAQGLVHRDVKPSNILIDGTVDRALLTDFGLARAVDDASLTSSGTIAGTPQYMSPEQARADSVDCRSDLFSLGSVMYAMCTGRAPFRAESSYSILRLITDKEPRQIREINPDVPEWLCMIISKLMAKQADDRFPSAGEVAKLLESCIAHLQHSTSIPLPQQLRNSLPLSIGRSKTAFANRLPARLWIEGKRIFEPLISRFMAIAVFFCASIFAGVVIVLETNTGILTIESEADDVPIRIKQGDQIVTSLIVDRDGRKTRLHAGQYTLEVDSPNSEYHVTDHQVVVTRGADKLVKITCRGTDQAGPIALVPQRRLRNAMMEFNNLHSSDASGKPKPPLDQDEILAFLKWRMGNDTLSDELVMAIQPVLYTRERMLPAGWRIVGGQIDEVCRHGVVHTWQIKLETNGLSKPLVIRRSAIAVSNDQKSVKTAQRPEAMVSLNSLVEQFNTKHRELERRAAIAHEIQPLTTDEVLAALAWSSTDDTSPSNSGAHEKWLPQIIATHYLPQGARIELTPSMENGIGQRFTIERIDLFVPDPTDSAKLHTFSIRHQFIGQDLDPSATRWSKPGQNGLQLGMRFLPAANAYQHQQVIDIEFLYRSATSRKIPVTLPATFQFAKVEGIRLERISFVEPKWPDGTTHTLIGNQPLSINGHRMQICFQNDEELKPGVNLKAISHPEAHHYVRIAVENPGADSKGEILEIAERLDFSILPLAPPKVLPLYESHYYAHWGASIPNYRLPEKSNPDPSYVDTFQIGVSLGPADQHRIPAYYRSGLQVTKVAPNSPAAAVGIEVGDVILSWEEHQIHGDDPAKPFSHYSVPNYQLKNELEKYRKSRGRSSYSIDLDLLDHRTSDVIRICPTFGMVANAGLTKAEILKRMTERKQLRQTSK